MVIDKPLVKKQFDAGLSTYHSNAPVQHKVVEQLVQLVQETGMNSFNQVLEIGCGSGFLTRELLLGTRIKNLSVNDISCTSQQHVSDIALEFGKDIGFFCGDAEEMPIPQGLDGVFFYFYGSVVF